MLDKVRKVMSGRKGFTLVELIVVLVILAILAAMLIPSLTGYIDKAKEKRVVAEVRQAVMAAQTLADEAYATADDTVNYSTVTLENIAELSEIEGTLNAVTVEAESGKIAYVSVTLAGATGYYTEDGEITVSETPPNNPADDGDYIALS